MDDFFYAAKMELKERSYRERHGDAIRDRDRKRYRTATPEQVAARSETRRRHYERNRAAACAAARQQREAGNRYRVEQLARQGGRCAICGHDDPGSKHGWHLDHSHAIDPRPAAKASPQSWRGVLCVACNTGLVGWVERHPRLRPLVPVVDAYLKLWEADNVPALLRCATEEDDP